MSSSLDKTILKDKRYRTLPPETVRSCTAIAKLSGIPKGFLLFCKKAGVKGFNSQGYIVWGTFRPDFEKRLDELIELFPQDGINLREQIQRADLRIKTLQAVKMEGKLISPEDVKQLLVSIATKTSAVIKKELIELPPRLAGKPEADIKMLIDQAMQSIFKVLQATVEYVDKINE